MRAVVQRVDEARVRVDGKVVGEIAKGFLVYYCAEKGDAETNIGKMADKIASFRIFPDENGKMNRSIDQVGGSFLVVSQFTLASDPFAGGNRPGFDKAMEKGAAEDFYNCFVSLIRSKGFTVETGIFGAHMKVESVNAGPLTFIFEL
ncbi:MAG TPA: D-tyrosyl-tRNA(Tyr) deacylase [Spirochaetaceae bacterium]|nr:D-tyrosyl-tRNA(Tyr) deacylase [Spirochaetaceae bacterium]